MNNFKNYKKKKIDKIKVLKPKCWLNDKICKYKYFFFLSFHLPNRESLEMELLKLKNCVVFYEIIIKKNKLKYFYL